MLGEMTPSQDFYAVTPSDTADLRSDSKLTKGLIIGGAGNLSVKRPNDNVTVTWAVVAGQTIPIKVRRVLSTSTTATGIIALF